MDFVLSQYGHPQMLPWHQLWQELVQSGLQLLHFWEERHQTMSLVRAFARHREELRPQGRLLLWRDPSKRGHPIDPMPIEVARHIMAYYGHHGYGKDCKHIWLVVSTPLKKLVNWDDYSQYMQEKNVPNHQPDMD